MDGSSPQAATESAGYGLRREVLSPLETLAQSVSTIAPTTTPVATIPLVCALAGNGTWLAYALATAAILLVALCIARFARYSSSPGSLYSYASMILPPVLGATAAWSLLLAYIATGASVIGGFYHLIVLVLFRSGGHLDLQQFHLRGVTGGGLRLGLVLALFSFVGFESATTLGSEARNPLKTIPRAVIQSALLAGAIFVVCAYTEVLGLRIAGQDLGTSEAPMRVLANVGGVHVLGVLIDIGALVSMFAGTLACITAAARVLLLMSHNGLAHSSLRATHVRNETPGRAILVTGTCAVVPVAVLAARGASGLDVYGWMGSLATYGFIVTYALVCLALPGYLRNHDAFTMGAQVVSVLACGAMLLALAGNLYPVPEGPYGKLPYIYLAYLAFGLSWFFFRSRKGGTIPAAS